MNQTHLLTVSCVVFSIMFHWMPWSWIKKTQIQSHYNTLLIPLNLTVAWCLRCWTASGRDGPAPTEWSPRCRLSRLHGPATACVHTQTDAFIHKKLHQGRCSIHVNADTWVPLNHSSWNQLTMHHLTVQHAIDSFCVLQRGGERDVQILLHIHGSAWCSAVSAHNKNLCCFWQLTGLTGASP